MTTELLEELTNDLDHNLSAAVASQYNMLWAPNFAAVKVYRPLAMRHARCAMRHAPCALRPQTSDVLAYGTGL